MLNKYGCINDALNVLSVMHFACLILVGRLQPQKGFDLYIISLILGIHVLKFRGVTSIPLPNQISVLCYRLDKPLFGLNKVFLYM